LCPHHAFMPPRDETRTDGCLLFSTSWGTSNESSDISLLDLTTLVTTEGRERTKDVFARLFAVAGFLLVFLIPLARPSASLKRPRLTRLCARAGLILRWPVAALPHVHRRTRLEPRSAGTALGRPSSAANDHATGATQPDSRKQPALLQRIR
jgi:hypothetical protein